MPKKRERQQFAAEAKEFVEERLLGQTVHVTLLTTDNNNNIYAQVYHKFGRISTSLLKYGLAKYIVWSANLCEENEKVEMRKAFEEAKDKRVNLWGVLDPDSAAGSDNCLIGVVTRVVSGDTLNVDIAGNTERFTLSSIRAPRLGGGGGGGAGKQQNSDYAEYAWEAKEYLRKATIGKRVELYKEYERPQGDDRTQTFATIYGILKILIFLFVFYFYFATCFCRLFFCILVYFL